MTNSYATVGEVFMTQMMHSEFKTLAPPGTPFTMAYWKDSIKRVEDAQKVVKDEIEKNKKTLSKADYTFYKQIHDEWFDFSLSQGYGSKERLESFSAVIDKFKKYVSKPTKKSIKSIDKPVAKLTDDIEEKVTEEIELTKEIKFKEEPKAFKMDDKAEAKKLKEETKKLREEVKKIKEEEKAKKLAQTKANIARMAKEASEL